MNYLSVIISKDNGIYVFVTLLYLHKQLAMNIDISAWELKGTTELWMGVG